MAFDPERDVEQAQMLARLLASGEYVEVLISCRECEGSLSALARRDKLAGISSHCMFCGSERVVLSALDLAEHQNG